MPKFRPGQVSALRRHKPSKRAVVTLDGRDHYLGPWPPEAKQPSPDAVEKYNRLVAEWLARGCQSPAAVRADPAPHDGRVTVGELILRFWRYAERHYRRPDGTTTNEPNNYRLAFRALRKLYETLPAAEFSPLRLKAVRRAMVDAGWSRPFVNRQVGRVVSAFKWAAGEELVPFSAYQALTAVRGFQKGRSEAPEPEPVPPVPDDVVADTLPFLPPPVRSMVAVQLLTGMRPGEVCAMRADEVDRSGPVWVYRPSHHKTAHRGKGRAVFLGPKAQALIAPWLLEAGGGYVFSPARWLKVWNAARSANRVTPLYPSHARRNAGKRTANPSRPASDRYSAMSYCKAIGRGVVRANADRARHDVAEGRHGPNLPAVPHWHPNQLRHSHATEVRRRYGLEAAGASLGHSKMSATEVYAERDLALAAKIAVEMG